MAAASNFSIAGSDFDVPDSESVQFDATEFLIKHTTATNVHDHSAGLGAAVKRLQTASAPSAAGEVRVNADELQWWGGSAGSVQTAVRTAGNQTVAGNKTFSSPVVASSSLTVGNSLVVSAGGMNVTGNAVFNQNLQVSGTVVAPVFVGDTANAGNTAGVTINQGAADDEVLSLKSSDVAHGITGITETDTYGLFAKSSNATGGLKITGVRATGAGSAGLWLDANIVDAADTAKSTGAGAPLIVESHVGNSVVGANGNLMVVANHTTTRFILDGDGDSHQDIGTSWTNFDDHDDLALLDATAALLDRDPGNLRKTFTEEFLEANRAILADARVVTFNDDGHHFVNWSRFQMLHMGATRALADRLAALEARLP